MRHGASPLRTPQGKSPLRVLMLALIISLQVIAAPRFICAINTRSVGFSTHPPPHISLHVLRPQLSRSH
jgi:hypothetical protein